MRYRLLKILSVAVVCAAIIFVLLYFNNQTPFNSQAIKKDISTNGLVPLENWQSEQEKLAKDKEVPEITLLAVGDVMLSRVVGQKMVKNKDYHYPFLKTQEMTAGADITFGNLESPIIAGTVVPTGSFSFRADPEAAEGLVGAGFDVLSLANNHILNQGEKGLLKTFELLKQNNIAYCGAGENLTALAQNAVIKEVNSIKVGFLCYSYGPTEYGAREKSAGISLMNTEKMTQEVKALKEKVDFIVVSMHAGNEYEHKSSLAQREFAHAAIDAGAELVLGHHPHVVQEVERYNEKYILHSLGNFVFDQMWSEATRQGIAAKFTLTREGVKAVNYFPLIIDDYSQARPANAIEGEKILKYLNSKY